MVNMKKHLGSKQEFTNWLTSMYLFYLINRLVDVEEGGKHLPEIHERTGTDKKSRLTKYKGQNYIYTY
jgi:hypothetical protein